MNLIKFFRRPKKKALNLDVTTSSWGGALRRAIYRSDDPQSLIERDRGWVYACCNLTANAISAAPLRLFVRGGTSRFATRVTGESVEVIEHPMLDLLKKANTSHTGIEMLRLTANYLDLLGNAYWFVEKERIGGVEVVTALYPLMAHYVRIVPDPQGGIAGYLYGTGANEQALPADQVIHFRMPSPGHPYYGLGPVQAALKASNRLDAVADYQQTLYDNNCRVEYALEIQDNPYTDPNDIKEQWDNNWAQRMKEGKPPIINGKDLKIQELSFRPIDTGLFDSVKLSKQELLAAFPCPEQFFEKSQSRAELEAAQVLFAEQCIEPRLRLIEAAINEQLLPMFDDSGRGFVKFDSTVPQDELLQAQVAEKYVRAGVITPNEVRADLGLPPLEGGDALTASPAPTGGNTNA